MRKNKSNTENEEKTENEPKTEKRFRHWSFLVYPDSAPPNWRDIIDDEHIAWVESPLHDKDVDDGGEIKKPHWHILVMFEGVKSFEQIREITDKVKAPIPIKTQSARGSVRYMVHLDNPDKFQYSRSDIIAHGGADIDDLLKPTSAHRYELIAEMQEYIVTNSITEFCDIAIYAALNRRDDWYPLLCDSCAYIIGQVIKSLRHKIRDENNESARSRQPVNYAENDIDRTYKIGDPP